MPLRAASAEGGSGGVNCRSASASACLRAWTARLTAVTGRRAAAEGIWGTGGSPAAALAVLILCIRSASARISSSVGDSAMVAVTMKVRMLIPRMSGSRKFSAVAPLITMWASAGAANMCIAAMPV